MRVGSRGAQKGWGWLGGLPRQMSARKNMMQAKTDRAARLRRGARRQSCCSVTASGRATPARSNMSSVTRRCWLTQALHVAGLYGCPDVISDCALCQSWRSTCLGAALAWWEGFCLCACLCRHEQRSAPARRQPCSRWWIGHLAKGFMICCCAFSCMLSASLHS